MHHAASRLKILPGYFLFVDRYQLSPHHKFQRRRKNSSQRRTLQALQFCLHTDLFQHVTAVQTFHRMCQSHFQYLDVRRSLDVVMVA